MSLRYYATASFQIVTGDLVGISQGTISTFVSNVSKKLTNLLHEYINMDLDDRKAVLKKLQV